MEEVRWGRYATFALWLAPYLLLVGVCAYGLGYVSAPDPTPKADPVTRTIVRKVISEAQLARLEAVADAFDHPPSSLAPLDAAAVEDAADVMDAVESGDVTVTPDPDPPAPTTTTTVPPTTTTTAEAGADRDHVFDYEPPTTTP